MQYRPLHYPGKMQSKRVANHDLGSVMVADAVGAKTRSEDVIHKQTLGVLREPSLSLLPGPTLTTAPLIGLSLALSGSISPPAVTEVSS